MERSAESGDNGKVKVRQELRKSYVMLHYLEGRVHHSSGKSGRGVEDDLGDRTT